MKMLANNASASQRQIDDMFNAYARGEQKEVLPVGIDELTLRKCSCCLLTLRLAIHLKRWLQH